MAVTEPYKFIGFGDMAVTKPYKFIGFGAMPVPFVKRGLRFGKYLGQLCDEPSCDPSVDESTPYRCRLRAVSG